MKLSHFAALAMVPLVAQAFLVPDAHMLDNAKEIFGDAVDGVKDSVKDLMSKMPEVKASSDADKVMKLSPDHKEAYLSFACLDCFGKSQDASNDALYLHVQVEPGKHASYLKINDKKVHPHRHSKHVETLHFQAKRVPSGEEMVSTMDMLDVEAEVKFVENKKEKREPGRDHRHAKPGPRVALLRVNKVGENLVNVPLLRIVYNSCPKFGKLLALERISALEGVDNVPAPNKDAKLPTKEELVNLKADLKQCSNLKCVFKTLVDFAKRTGKSVQLWIVKIYRNKPVTTDSSDASTRPTKPPCNKPWKWPHPSYQGGEQADNDHKHPHHHRYRGYHRFLCILKKVALTGAFVSVMILLVVGMARLVWMYRNMIQEEDARFADFIARLRRQFEPVPTQVPVDEDADVVDEKESLLRDEKMETGQAYHDEDDKQ